MSKQWTMYPPVASPEAAAYDRRDNSDLAEDLEPAEWEVDPALLAELDREMQQQAEEGAALSERTRTMNDHETRLPERYVILHGLMAYAEEHGTTHTLAYQQWHEEAIELDREMQEQAEEGALLAAQMEAPAVGTPNDDEPPY